MDREFTVSAPSVGLSIRPPPPHEPLLIGGYSADTKVVMFTGEIREMRTLQKNDVLMGDDGTPRIIDVVQYHREALRKVEIYSADPLYVSVNQMLCYKATESVSCFWADDRKAYRVMYSDGRERKTVSFPVLKKGNEHVYPTADGALQAARDYAAAVTDRAPASQRQYIEALEHRQFISEVNGGYLVYTAKLKGGDAKNWRNFIYNNKAFSIRAFCQRNKLKKADATNFHYATQEEAHQAAYEYNETLALKVFNASAADPRTGSIDTYRPVDAFSVGLTQVLKRSEGNKEFFQYGYTNINKRFTFQNFRFSPNPIYPTEEEALAAAESFMFDLHNQGIAVPKSKEEEKTLREYMDLTEQVRRLWLLYRASTIDFEEQELTVDPYYLGLWLGDGSRRTTGITNNHETEIVNFLGQYAESLSMRLAHYEGTLAYAIVQRRGAQGRPDTQVEYPELNAEDFYAETTATRFFRDRDATARAVNANPAQRTLGGLERRPGVGRNCNILLDALRRLNVTPDDSTAVRTGPTIDRKHVPAQYKFNSEANRLLLLAGFLDSDGSYYPQQHRFHIIQSERWHETLFFDMVWVARSLGFNVSHWMRELTTNPPGATEPFTGNYLEGYIKGDVERIPCLLARKQPRLRLSNKDPLVSSIRSIAIEPDTSLTYCISVAGQNKRFLRHDFLVLRSCEKAP